MSSSPSTLQRIPTETIQKAIDALFKWRNSTQKPQKLFDDDDEFVYLVLTLKKIPQNGVVTKAPHKIPLPNTLLSPHSETCLIVDDRPKSGLTKAQAQSKIAAENVAVSSVLKLSKLASDYKPFEEKRKLCDSYDVFFADKRVVPLLPRLLGKQFYKKKKVPLPLDLKKANWKEQVDRACSSAVFSVGTGTCSVVRVAKVSMARDEVVANVVAAIEGIVEVVPKKWGNVRSFHVKLLESLALPVYQAAPDVRLRIEGGKGEEKVVVEKEKKDKKKEEGEKAKKKVKKGMIHEIRYMDGEVGEDCVKGELGCEDSDDGYWGIVSKKKELENGEKGSLELASNKRKKGDRVGNGDLNELSCVKLAKKSANDMTMMKKKKSGLGLAH